NGGLIRSDGGSVLLTAQAAGDLLATVINNTGVIRAQTLSNVKGSIKLLGDMQSGSVNVAGTLDASAPNGGDGGFIETSAAHVNVASGTRITTASAQGATGTWLIDPQDFIVGSVLGDNITGADLQALLVNNNVIISTLNAPDTSVPGAPYTRNTSRPGNGDIFINDVVEWTAAAAPTTLTLNAERDVNINAAIKPTDGNLVVCCGRDVNVDAPITAVRGSVLLSAGRNVNQRAAMTATNGNIEMCAAGDINVGAALTLTNGTLIAARSLGLPQGLVLRADSDGTGPGVAGGTVNFDPLLVKPYTVTNAPVAIYYNPVSYTAPADYLPKFTLTAGAVLAQKMLVFPDGANKLADGTTTANFTTLKGLPSGVTLVADPGNTANFDSAAAGLNKSVSFSGYSLAGANASDYAFAVSCCGVISAKTTATVFGSGVGALSLLNGATGTAPSSGTLLAGLAATATAGSLFDVLSLSDAGLGELALESTTEAALSGLPLTVASSGSSPPFVLSTSPLASSIGLPQPEPLVAPALPAVVPAAAPYVAPVYAPKQDRY
ncbi:MAG: hypothetical protein JWQ72_454, partial [Polaromonas sp.]|nr:hypothetical protein [Polaromonas sp.]